MPWNTGLVVGTPAYQIASSNMPRIRVLAGPGTGKSFAMQKRVAKLLEDGIEPRQILPVTFTKVAAEDLHRSLVNMGVPGCDDIQGRTLHSLAMRILMRNHVLQATGRRARTLAEFELKPMLEDLSVSLEIGLRELKRRLSAFEAAWARLQTDEPGYVQSPQDVAFNNALLRWMNGHEAMLVGEVIPELLKYLRNNPAAEELAEFSHVLVDEYQDLNKAEQEVIRLLSLNGHACIVGDDDQSIYSFKHAHPQGIREWGQINQALDVSLVDCHRCPRRVVDIANQLIQHNTRPIPRQLLPVASKGEGEIYRYQYQTVQQEVNGVTALVANLVANGTPAGDILILAQRKVIGTPIYNQLKAANISVKSYYAESELENNNVQRRFALLKLLANRQDRVALRWLLGFGASKRAANPYRHVFNHCIQNGGSPWDVLEQMVARTLSLPRTASLLTRFNQIKEELALLNTIPDLNGLVDHLFPSTDDTCTDLRALCLRTIAEMNDGNQNVANFVKNLSEAIIQPDVPSEITEVRIMSLHKSKGLSAPVTIIAGCVEGLLPQQPDEDLSVQEQNEKLEEARRLFFVGITRVKAKLEDGKVGILILTHAMRMPVADALGANISPAGRRYGMANLLASRFLNELGPTAPTPIAVP